MSQIIRYGLPIILIITGMIMFTNSYVSNSLVGVGNEKSIGIEAVVLSRCNESFENNPTAYLSCVGANLRTEEIHRVIVGEFKTLSNERGELAHAINTTTGISIKDIESHGILGGGNSEIRKIWKLLFEQKKPECLQLGVSSGSDDCGLYESLLSNLRESSFFYNKLTKMTVGEVAEINLALNPSNSEEAKAQLKELKGVAAEGKSKIARHMSAELFGASFEVNPSGPQKRVVLDSNTTKWKWKVKPLKEGTEELLTLDVYVHLEVNGKLSPPITIKTYREKILVDVSGWDAINSFVATWSSIIGLLLTIVGSVWTAYLWFRSKKWKLDVNEK